MVFNATVNNSSDISWQSVLSVGETGGSGENHLPVASHWQTLSIMVYTSPCSRFELTTSVVICTDCLGSSKSNYHTITARTAPFYSCILNNHDNNLTLIFLVMIKWKFVQFSSYKLSICHFSFMNKVYQKQWYSHHSGLVWFMVFNATFSNIWVISSRSVLLEFPKKTTDLSHV